MHNYFPLISVTQGTLKAISSSVFQCLTFKFSDSPLFFNIIILKLSLLLSLKYECGSNTNSAYFEWNTVALVPIIILV